MITRIVAGLTGLAIIVPALLWGGELAVELIVPPFLVICLGEYAAMAFPEDRVAAFTWLLVTTGGLYVTLLYVGTGAVWPAFSVMVVATMIFVLLRPGPDLQTAADRVGRYLVGTTWVGLLVFLPMLRRLEDGIGWCFLVLALAWLSDTGGYFAGRAFGRHKLYERISPKKTWEGLAGGLVFASGGAVIIKWLALPSVGWAEAVGLGIVVGSIGVLGDLAESLLKRAYQVKDSGRLLPGHGGILDRIDALLFVAPVLFLHATLVKGYAWTF